MSWASSSTTVLTSLLFGAKSCVRALPTTLMLLRLSPSAASRRSARSRSASRISARTPSTRGAVRVSVILHTPSLRGSSDVKRLRGSFRRTVASGVLASPPRDATDTSFATATVCYYCTAVCPNNNGSCHGCTYRRSGKCHFDSQNGPRRDRNSLFLNRIAAIHRSGSLARDLHIPLMKVLMLEPCECDVALVERGLRLWQS